MANKTIDARGMLCPKPLIMTKKAILDTQCTGGFILLLDNEISRENVERYLTDNGITFSTLKENGTFTITVKKPDQEMTAASTQGYCNTGYEGGAVVCITGSTMGQGSNDLGSILIQAFINTLGESDPLPEAVIFYNSGVILTEDSSPVIESLRELEKRGVDLLICGTCVDFFELNDKISTGKISNMYSIIEKLNTASRIIYP